MNRYTFLFIAAAVILLLSACKSKSNTTGTESAGNENLPVIELQGDYPHKDVDIHELADVKYIPLETTDESLIGAANLLYMGNDTLIIRDVKQHKILLFDTEGKYLSSFQRIGNGAKEYTRMASTCVDADAREIYISDFYRPNRIAVFNYAGDFVRDFNVDSLILMSQIFDYDHDNLLVSNEKDMYKISFGEKVSSYPYYLVSKQTGKATPVPLWVESRKSDSFTVKDDMGNLFSTTVGGIHQLTNSYRGFVISDYALDTVYRYVNQVLEPLFVRHADNDHPGLLSGVLLDNDNFCLIGVMEVFVENEEMQSKEPRLLMYMYDSGKVGEISLGNKDVPADLKWVRYGANNGQYPAEVFTVMTYQADYLLDQYQENGLSGQLKEVAAKLQPEDNPVLVIIRNKQNKKGHGN